MDAHEWIRACLWDWAVRPILFVRFPILVVPKLSSMLLSAFTLFHVVISLVGIASGFVVLWGLLTARTFDRWTAVFLATTVATSATGFLFPVQHFMPSHAVGILSLGILAIAIFARYLRQLKGAWRKTYVVTAMVALYFNVFVGIVQSFQKIPALHALAPTQAESPFKVTQLAVLVIFVVLTVVAATRFRPTTSKAA